METANTTTISNIEFDSAPSPHDPKLRRKLLDYLRNIQEIKERQASEDRSDEN